MKNTCPSVTDGTNDRHYQGVNAVYHPELVAQMEAMDSLREENENLKILLIKAVTALDTANARLEALDR